MMRRLVAGLAVVFLVAGCGASPAASPRTGSATSAPPASGKELKEARERAGIADCPATGDQAVRDDGLPDLTLACLGSDRTVRLAGLRGKPAVINIWAQWCRPCRIEAPHLAAVSQQAGSKVDFIGIDFADPDPEAAIEFARKAGWSYPQLQDYDQQVKGPLKIIGVPQTFLVDADGKIVYRQVKPFTSDTQLQNLIQDRLGVQL